MSLSAAVIDALVASGATVEQLAAAVKADLRDQETKVADRRQKDAERQQRSRANRKMSRNVTVTPRDNCDLPNEYISNPSVFDGSNEPSAVSSLQDRVVEAWNAKIEGSPLPAARKLIGNRLKHLRCRVREHGEEAVFTAIENMIASDWHSGRSGKWLEGNLGWLLKNSENFEKMLERTNAQPPTATPSNLAILSEQAQRYRRPEAA